MNAVVPERTLLSFSRTLLHLVRFDLRRFRLFVALIVGLEVAYAAFVEWSLHLAPVTISERFGGPFGSEEGGLLAAMLTLATIVATAAIVQGDLPSDDRAFWRTRPIAPLALATAKLATFAVLFVVLPSAINAWRLAAYGAPMSAMAAATAHVLLQAGGIVAPTWAIAIATRTLPRFLAAVAAIIIGGYLALAALVYWLAGAGQGALANGTGIEVGWQGDGRGLATMVAFTAIAFAILVAHYRLRRSLVAVTAGLVLVATAGFLPGRPAAGPAPPDLAQLIDGRLRLPDGIGVPASWLAQGAAGWPAYLSGRVELPPLPEDVSAAVLLGQTHVVVDGRRIAVRGMGQCCSGRGPIGVVAPAGVGPAMPAPEEAPLLFGLTAQFIPAVAGRRIAMQGEADVAFARHHLVAALPLRPGAAFRTGRYLFEILGLEPARRVLLFRFARFPRFGEGMTEGLSLFIADPARTRVITTTPAWRVAPVNAASGTHEWARGRTWSGRFQVMLTGIATPPAGAQLLIVETSPAGVARTTLSAADVAVRAPRIE